MAVHRAVLYHRDAGNSLILERFSRPRFELGVVLSNRAPSIVVVLVRALSHPFARGDAESRGSGVAKKRLGEISSRCITAVLYTPEISVVSFSGIGSDGGQEGSSPANSQHFRSSRSRLMIHGQGPRLSVAEGVLIPCRPNFSSRSYSISPTPLPAFFLFVFFFVANPATQRCGLKTEVVHNIVVAGSTTPPRHCSPCFFLIILYSLPLSLTPNFLFRSVCYYYYDFNLCTLHG